MADPGCTRSARRRWLAGAATWALGGIEARAASAAPAPSTTTGPAPSGWAEPRREPPALALHCEDGRIRALPDCLRGAVTAVQLMFTGCNGSCPVQGALFAQIASRLPAQGFQLLSLSVDALGDSPPTLAHWQARFGAPTRAWRAAVPAVADVDRLAAFLRGLPPGMANGAHTAQVFVFDAQGRLAHRSGDNPEAAWVEALMVHVARGGRSG
jgi:protein SCO1/2